MQERPAGDDAVLLDFGDAADPGLAASWAAGLIATAAAQGRLLVSDVIPAAETVLVQAAPGSGLDVLGVRRVLRELHDEAAPSSRTAYRPSPTGSPVPAGETPTVVLAVHYDGADLAEVAAHAGTTTEGVIAAHTAIRWRVQFMGFAPGFGYLVPAPESPAGARAMFASLSRRAESRPAVPAGSVAVAAGYSAVYPRPSPGGWFLLGHTVIPVWNIDAKPPALLSAGATVRFTCAD